HAGDGSTRHRQEYGVEIHDRQPGRRQRAAENQHAQKPADPSACRLVHPGLRQFCLYRARRHGGSRDDAVQSEKTVMAIQAVRMDEESEIKEQGETLIDAVMGAIRRRIGMRSLTPGAKLPSIRAFAATMRVSKSTVVEAYERLMAEGVIQSRPGSGYYVAAPLAPLRLSEIGPKLDREIDPLWISRQSLEAGDTLLKPGCGWLPADWMPQEGLRRALRSLSRSHDFALADYGTPLGLPALRQLLARRMGSHGIEVAPGQVVLTESGTQAIDLVCRFLIEPGDTVLVDDPCYFNFHALLRAHRARV